MVDSNSDFRANWLMTLADSAFPLDQYKEGTED